MSFIPLTGGGVGGAYIPGDKFGAQTAEKIRTNFNDHETRIGDLETTVAGGSSVATLTDVALGSPLSTGDVLTYTGSVWTNDPPAAVDLATADVTGRLPLANLVQGSALSVLGVTGNATANEASIVAASDGQVLRRSGTSVGFGAVDLASANAITGALPLANLPTTLAQILKATVTLTNAQILALPTTPITAIAAPSSGFWNHVLAASFRGSFAAAAYTNANVTYSALAIYALGDFTQWSQNAIINDSTVSITRLTDFLNTTPLIIGTGPYQDSPSDGNVALNWVLPNQQVVASVNGIATAIKIDNNGSGNLTGGNAANTMKVTLYYTVEAL